MGSATSVGVRRSLKRSSSATADARICSRSSNETALVLATNWHWWRAWRPVRVAGRLVFFTLVERRRVVAAGNSARSYWEYR